MSHHNEIIVKNAKEHNLKGIDVHIPRDALVVITGLSGSGKSSLAFDTIYAEGQRRYVESLSSYARQFLDRFDKPDVESIEGLSPAISIDQKTTSKNPRSTVGTVTEIYDYLRILFARIGTVHCYKCGKKIDSQSVQQIVDALLRLPEKTKFQLLAPVVRGKKGEYKREFEHLAKEGFVRVVVDGEQYELGEDIKLEKNKKHTISVVVDRLVIKEGIKRRLAESVELALRHGDGMLLVDIIGGETLTYSENFACPDCEISYPALEPRMFSFNSPHGACPECDGLGTLHVFDEHKVIVNPELPVLKAVAGGMGFKGRMFRSLLRSLAKHCGFRTNTPYQDLPRQVQQILLYGAKEKIDITLDAETGASFSYRGKFEGLLNNLKRRYLETPSERMRSEMEKLMTFRICPACHGGRLRKESLSIRVGGVNLQEFTEMTIGEAVSFIRSLKLNTYQQKVGERVIKEINERLSFLENVGLHYLTLSRGAATLSGGESQRIRLATQIGAGLMGVLYILDEPSIGLHQRDNEKLLETLKRLRDMGNTVIVVEHDEDTMRVADHIIDIGPGAGKYGGEIIAEGDYKAIVANKKSVTGNFLSGRETIALPEKRRKGSGESITIKKAVTNNLKSIDVSIPLNTFTVVTGVSGSGKSSLVFEVLCANLPERFGITKFAKYRSVEFQPTVIKGLEHIDEVILIDQSPIGRTPRSNPATYTGVFDKIRQLFSQVPDAKARGYKPGRFSFNVKGGRCETCAGDGLIKIEMHFLPDVYVKCEECQGERYNRETLEVKYKGRNIADVLNMPVSEAVDFFDAIPDIKRKLQTLFDVGLGYIQLGQFATTLSGGEAQRIKLAKELSRSSRKRSLYILDEPTTGLHFADVKKLLEVLNRLVENNNSLVVIEHNLDVIKSADHIIDLGPEGGNEGGRLLFSGTPEGICKKKGSHTGQFLKKHLDFEEKHRAHVFRKKLK